MLYAQKTPDVPAVLKSAVGDALDEFEQSQPGYWERVVQSDGESALLAPLFKEIVRRAGLSLETSSERAFAERVTWFALGEYVAYKPIIGE